MLKVENIDCVELLHAGLPGCDKVHEVIDRSASNTPPFRLLQRSQEFRSVEFDDTNAWENGLSQKLRGQIGIRSDS